MKQIRSSGFPESEPLPRWTRTRWSCLQATPHKFCIRMVEKYENKWFRVKHVIKKSFAGWKGLTWLWNSPNFYQTSFDGSILRSSGIPEVQILGIAKIRNSENSDFPYFRTSRSPGVWNPDFWNSGIPWILHAVFPWISNIMDFRILGRPQRFRVFSSSGCHIFVPGETLISS